MMRKTLTLIFILGALFTAHSRTTIEDIRQNPLKAGGIYLAYPVSESLNTAPPKGYVPFYVSHYGRHGSRYLIGDNDYIWVTRLMERADSAKALTPLGLEVTKRLRQLRPMVEGRGGDLSALGERQHRDIGRRCITAFPQAFPDNAEITAKSTIVMRCALSMCAFAEGLKEVNPRLAIPREASMKNMDYLNYHSPQSNYYTRRDGEWAEENRKFKEAMTRPDRLVSSLFADTLFIHKNVNPGELMWGLYWIAVDMQDIESGIDFIDIFTPEELFDLWRSHNYSFYTTNCNHPLSKGLTVANAKNLLRNILESAADKIDRGCVAGADLRFGHDGNIIPLAAILNLEGCHASEGNPYRLHEVYSDYQIAPMAGNIQIVFFKPSKKGTADDVLVKFMLNEREIAVDDLPTDNFPYYRWADVRDFWQSILDS